MSLALRQPPSADLVTRFRVVRAFSEQLCRPLTLEDTGLQVAPEVSPPRWHLAHTTWFFETFILKPQVSGYQAFDDRFEYLFNSYYNGVGEQYPRPQRHLLSRPGYHTVLEWRACVDDALQALLAESEAPELLELVALGIEHERQHQELIVTDIKYSFSHNPQWPVYQTGMDVARPASPLAPALSWHEYPGGLVEVGASPDAGFCFDNETPRHRQWLEPFALASRPSTCGEYLAFMADGGYEHPELWLSDGWDWVQRQRARAPLYWFVDDDPPQQYTLAGRRSLRLDEPVVHINYYEADAFARWCGARLPTEAEWEVAAADQPVEGGFVDNGRLHPSVARSRTPDHPQQLFGDVWEWTASAYLPYPGYVPASGAVGEYNGKFMVNQMVLRGGSCASSRDHLRASYRNFFYPHMRWQFSGVRLARGGAGQS